LESGIVKDDELRETDERIRGRVEAEVELAQSDPEPPISSFFANVYAPSSSSSNDGGDIDGRYAPAAIPLRGTECDDIHQV
jgi:TPP-dependent pyruvate/acetoin dehydrogenase alpha subunit